MNACLLNAKTDEQKKILLLLSSNDNRKANIEKVELKFWIVWYLNMNFTFKEKLFLFIFLDKFKFSLCAYTLFHQKEGVSKVFLFVIPTEVGIFNFLINRFPFTREWQFNRLLLTFEKPSLYKVYQIYFKLLNLYPIIISWLPRLYCWMAVRL